MPLDFTPLDSIQEEHEQERVAQCSHSLQILALLVEFSPECTGACFNVEMRAGGSCTGLEKRALVHSDVASGQLAFDPARASVRAHARPLRDEPAGQLYAGLMICREET